MQFIGLPRQDFVLSRNDTVFNILKLFDYNYSLLTAHCKLPFRQPERNIEALSKKYPSSRKA
ncbi:MAG: hypothetical protein IJV35_07630 [Neisseriaceae bacterium]|nr:hypothetical protein [Neisseriaceae bacterium]